MMSRVSAVAIVWLAGPTSEGGNRIVNSGSKASASAGSPKRPDASPASVMPTWIPAT
jgi:hypothetical protein